MRQPLFAQLLDRLGRICSGGRLSLSLGLCFVLISAGKAGGGAWDSVAPSPQRDQGTIQVPLDKSRVIDLSQPAARISIANPAIADILAINERQIYINGKELGTTNMILWDDADRVQRQIGLEVTHDLQTLKEKLHQFLPRERIEVASAKGAIVLSGEVSSPTRLDAAMRLAQSFAGGAGGVINLLQVGGAQQVLLEVRVAEVQRNFAKQIGVDFLGLYDGGSIKIDLLKNANSGTLNQISGSSFNVGSGSNFDTNAGSSVNSSFGSDFSLNAGSRVDSESIYGFGSETGSFSGSEVTNQRFFEGAAGVVGENVASRFGGNNSTSFGNSSSSNFGSRDIVRGLNLPSTGAVLEFLSGNFLGTTIALDVAEAQGLARILAEPNLTTLSGQQAQFISGGEFPVPVFSGSNDQEGTSIEFKPFGIEVSFLPIVLDRGLISLKVKVSVSELSDEAAVVVGASNVSSVTAIPSLRTRGAESTVEVPSGQTIAIAGLLNEVTRTSGDRYPGLGDLPVLGALFRSQQFQKRQTELVIFVTPKLARPFDTDLVKLPTDDFVDPSDVEFYLQGRLYGNRAPNRFDGSNPTSGSGAGRLGPDKSGSEGPFGHDL